MSSHPHVSGLILAGGRARRLAGRSKAELPLGGDPARTPLARILAVFKGRFDKCVLVGPAGRDPSPPEDVSGPEILVTSDRIEGGGPLAGIHAGLLAVPTRFAFVVGCDMPSLSGDLIDLMAGRARPGRLLVPVFRGRPEPLHAIYPVGCAGGIEASLSEGVRMMLDYFARAPVDYLPESEFRHLCGSSRSFLNINTPEDLDAWAEEDGS